MIGISFAMVASVVRGPRKPAARQRSAQMAWQLPSITMVFGKWPGRSTSVGAIYVDRCPVPVKETFHKSPLVTIVLGR
jgi:hypothetical protein